MNVLDLARTGKRACYIRLQMNLPRKEPRVKAAAKELLYSGYIIATYQ